MNALTYRITLEEPVLVTALGGEPNGAVALNHLPGSVLRGAVIATYLRQHNRADLEAGDLTACRLFLDGRTRFLNAYPLAGDRRSLPTPLSWYRRKEDEKEIDLHDFAFEEPSEENDWQPATSPFRVLEEEGSSAVLIRPGRQVSIHTARNRRFGRPQERTRVRPDEDPGAVYRYESLASEQTFAGVVVCDPADIHTLLPLLDGPALLGGARSAGYGRVRLHDAMAETDWVEEPVTVSSPPPPGGKVTFTLLSDALVRDEPGQLTIAPAAVARALGFTLNPGQITAFVKGAVVGGFNRKWGLPLPQALAVAMGSVLVLPEAPGLSESHLRKLVEEGIGERRSEGFGRVAVNSHVRGQIRGARPGASRAERVPLTGQTEAHELALLMTGRMLRQRLDAGVADRAVRLTTAPPRSKHQLARLRLLLRDALNQAPVEGRQRLLDYLDGLERRQTTRRQFTQFRIAGRPALEWLRGRISDTSEIWSQLDVRDSPRVGGVAPARDEALAYEYNLRLVDAVLARTARLRRQEGD